MNPTYNSLPKRTNGHLQSLYKSEEQIAIESLTMLENDAIEKGRKGEPIGTKKNWGGVEYIKTGKGWTPSKKAKAAHEVIHGKKEEGKLGTSQQHIDKVKKELGSAYSSAMDGELRDEHYKKVEDHVKSGGKISKELYDSLDSGKKFHFDKHHNSRGDKVEGNTIDLNKEIEFAAKKFSQVTERGDNINIIQHKNGEINYNFDNKQKVGDTKHTDGSDMSGKVVHVIEGKKRESDGLDRFKDIVNNSSSLDEAFEKIKTIKDVPASVANSFREKYDPEENLTPKKAFEKFYNEVKGVEGEKKPIIKPVDLSGARSGAKTNAEIAEANRTREKREYGEELKTGDSVVVNPDHPEVEFKGKVVESFGINGVSVDTGDGRPTMYNRKDVISAEKHNASKKEDKPELNEEEKRHYDYLVERFNRVDDAAKKRMVDNSKNYIEVAKQFDEDNGVKDSDTDPRVIASKQFVKDHESKVNSIEDRSKLFAVGTPARTQYEGREVSGEVVMNKIAMWYPEKGENRELYVAGTLKGLSLYRDSNYSGSSERFIVPDWNKVKSFYEK